MSAPQPGQPQPGQPQPGQPQPGQPQPDRRLDGRPGLRVPLATYRLQLHRSFDFTRAAAALPYLKRLGISDVYLSPIWQAVPGSTHGYDVTDHTVINPELGGLRGFQHFSDAARALDLGVLLDFVPNHMGVGGGHNRYWEDVLEHGQASVYAHFFDIDWEPLKRSLRGKVLLPVLGDLYGRVLERRELRVVRDGGRFGLQYFERTFPLSPRTLAPLMGRAEQLCTLSETSDLRADLASLAHQAAGLPRSDSSPSDGERQSRARETGVIARRLDALRLASPAIARALNAAMRELNGDTAALDRLIREQNYRLSYWRVATEQINYRRFFDINDLAALRMEDPRVFEWAHSQLYAQIGEGRATGVRLDHTDGLYDPAGYFRSLQAGAARTLGHPEPGPHDRGDQLPLYVVAEKILEPGESLPQDWPIHGTTGYDFLAQSGGVFVDGGGEEAITAIYRRATGERLSYGETLHDTKELVLRTSLASELAGLAERLERLSERDLRWRDFTLSTLRTALREVIATFPVYRTYLREDGQRELGDDAKIGHAIADARRLNRDLDPSIFDFLQMVLTLDTDSPLSRQAYAGFALAFQQLTGPVTAKGAEDTAFYRYVRLLSLNEVGGDPALFGTPPATFHSQARARGKSWPHAMLSGSTHDTKRGEDTRARISLLSELPEGWSAYLSGWSRLGRALERPQTDGTDHQPSTCDRYALLQTILGAWPLDGNLKGFADRLVQYAVKSAREAKRHTGWANPDRTYEAALEHFARGLLESPEFTASMDELQGRLSPYGAQNSLSNTLLRLTVPGVPDTYQGSETWNQSLVDPDNRRPVDYRRLETLLGQAEERHAREPLQLARELLDGYRSGAVKQLVSWAALRLRQERPALFQHGDYHPVEAGKYLVAFSRRLEGRGGGTLVVAAPRLSLSLTREKQPWATGEVWGARELRLPQPGRWRNVLTGERHEVTGEKLALSALFGHFPLALLILE